MIRAAAVAMSLLSCMMFSHRGQSSLAYMGGVGLNLPASRWAGAGMVGRQGDSVLRKMPPTSPSPQTKAIRPPGRPSIRRPEG